MGFFCDANLDADKGKELEKAIKYYINYVKRHNGEISPRFENNLSIRILEGSSTLAEANANTEKNLIKLRPNISIVTLFHELRHLSDQWQDPEDGEYYGCWEYEKDYDSQMSLPNPNNKIVTVNRGVHGRFLGEAVAELYATKVYWEMCNYSSAAQNYTSKRTYYDDEVITLKQICVVLGIDEDKFLNLPSKNDMGRNILKKRCAELTGKDRVWDILEDNLDFIEMKKVISTSHPDLIISEPSQNAFKSNKENVKKIFDYILNASLNRNLISTEEYNNRAKQLKNLAAYNRNYRRLVII